MKKHIIICYLIACIGLIVGIFVIIYSNFISGFRFKYPVLWGSCIITIFSLIRLSHLKKMKNKWIYYYVCAIMIIIFIMSVVDLHS